MAALRILVTGSSGFFGGFVVDAVRRRGHVPLTTSRRGGDAAVDLCAPGMIAAVTEALQPERVLHLAAMSRLDRCEADPDGAQRVNAWLAGQWAERFGPAAWFTSTDLVFDGRVGGYAENAAPAPLSAYGTSKLQGEEQVLRRGGRVVRLPLLFGPDGDGRGATASLRRALDEGRVVRLFTNEYRTPLHARDAADALVAMAIDGDGAQLSHLPGPERVSRWQLGQRFCAAQGLPTALLEPVECQDPLRPRDVSMVGARCAGRSLDEMLGDG
ncbi:MAG: sugar nucleotide-binding protein [Planctomycetes bacterium]|nr:sugar nucleotide-binding protein [Planctomycetota bacterium]